VDWSNERYVRLYTRDSVTWSLWPWEARALFCFLLRKVDRAGVLDLGGNDPVRAVAAVVGMPLAMVKEHLPAIIESGAVEVGATAMVMPNYIEAQEAKSSDKQRQSESRARRRDRARIGHDTQHDVTQRDTSSQPVTRGHDASHDVTPSLAEPSRAKPSCTEIESPAKPATRAREPEYSAEVIEIAQYLYDAISEHSPDAFSSDPKKVEALLLGWCKAIDLAMRKGTKATKSERGFNGPNMTLAGAKAVIDLAHRGADDFWHRNMISGSSLRNCYARLVIEARKAYAGARKTNGRPDLSVLDDFDFEAAGSLWEAVENEQRRNQASTS